MAFLSELTSVESKLRILYLSLSHFSIHLEIMWLRQMVRIGTPQSSGLDLHLDVLVQLFHVLETSFYFFQHLTSFATRIDPLY